MKQYKDIEQFIWVSCKRKVKYKTEQKAIKYALKYDLEYYHCPICNYWHTTKKVLGTDKINKKLNKKGGE